MTQIQLTDQQLNRALAELIGYRVVRGDKLFRLCKDDVGCGGFQLSEDIAWQDTPDYCTDPAASLEVQTAATKVNAKVYVDTLYDIRLTNEGYTPEIAIGESTYSHDGVVYLFDASPRERAEAAYITLQGST